MAKAMGTNDWVSHLDSLEGFGFDHLNQFVTLWEMLSHVTLSPDTRDSIRWKFTNDGIYSASSTYKMQLEGLIASNMNQVIWKTWAPPKCNVFAWLDRKSVV